MIAHPFYRDYIVRVHLTEIVSVGVGYMKGYQVFQGTDGEIGIPSIQEIKGITGAKVFMKGYGCIKGYERWSLWDIPRNKVAYFGFNPKYVSSVGLQTANLEKKCSLEGSKAESTHELRIVLDIKELYGVEPKNNGQTTELTELEMKIIVGDYARIFDIRTGEYTDLEGGVITTCALMINWYELRLPDYYPKSTIPPVCRYAITGPYISVPSLRTL